MFSYGKNNLELFRSLLEKQENNEVIWQAINEVCQINSKGLDAAREVFSLKNKQKNLQASNRRLLINQWEKR